MIILEINSRVYGKRFDEITDGELRGFAALGFDWIWMMGVWQISPEVLSISRRYGLDYQGSPYAIAAYEVSRELGGEAALRSLTERAHAAGLRVMVDFVPNHLSVDSPLIDEHPEWVIHSNPSARDEYAVDYFEHPKGRLAHGKDPNFSGWVDTVQLDYSHPGLRAHMTKELLRIASLVDGVRCDMAMLVLRDQVKRQWFPRVPQAEFDATFPAEFWPIAIETVRAARPRFVFMAEVYWGKEAYLQELGFDLTYDKDLYDLLAHHKSAEEVTRHLRSMSLDYMARSVHFLENHDEDRAATKFGRRARPSAILSFAIPGAPFVHQGQMEGYTEKLPVQRVKPLKNEEPDEQLLAFYARLLSIVKQPIFRQGDAKVLPPQAGLVLVERSLDGRFVIAGADTRWARGARATSSPALVVPIPPAGARSGSGRPRVCVDLWTGETLSGASLDGGELRLTPGAVASFEETGGLLLEICTE